MSSAFTKVCGGFSTEEALKRRKFTLQEISFFSFFFLFFGWVKYLMFLHNVHADSGREYNLCRGSFAQCIRGITLSLYRTWDVTGREVFFLQERCNLPNKRKEVQSHDRLQLWGLSSLRRWSEPATLMMLWEMLRWGYLPSWIPPPTQLSLGAL